MYFINIIHIKELVVKKVIFVRLVFLYVGDMGANEGLFMSALFSSHLHSICPSGQQLVAFHNLSSGTESLLLIDKMFIILFHRQNASCWIRLFCWKITGQMLYLSCSSISSLNVWLKMVHLLKSLHQLRAELFSLQAKLLLPSTECSAEPLQEAYVRRNFCCMKKLLRYCHSRYLLTS